MSDAIKFTPSPVFDRAASALDLAIESFWFNQYPAEQAAKLEGRIKMAAKLLAKLANLQHSHALEVVAQALRFPSWHHLSAHLTSAQAFEKGLLPAGWLDALAGAVVLTVQAEDDVAMPAAQLEALEQLGETLAMLTDTPKQHVLDGVSAALCGGRSWQAVRRRSPLYALEPLYRFVVYPKDAEGGSGGSFEESPACSQLVEQLDEQWQGYDEFTKPRKKQARRWVESTLAAQPGFLEAGLALAWMQREAKEAEALTTANRFVRLAEALMPKGYKGHVRWGHLGNRVYHRLLWLQMSLNHDAGLGAAAAKVARKMLRLNPGDNLGVRYVLPFLQLEHANLVAAKRSLKALESESGLTASATRAFVAFALDDLNTFRRELTEALFTLPMLRAFLLNDPKALPKDEPGYRSVQPDMDTFAEFAWPSYCILPGLRAACQAFLAEPVVLQTERELRTYWSAYWPTRGDPARPRVGSHEGWEQLLTECIDRVARCGPAHVAR
ncbi:hypothetical protein JI742_07495 [Piscinibacter sp. Jin2]|uniref:Uncharacterized protein n=1 Tax=Aquariibacter lacus TaxID=2801332 RepID=A0A9X1BND6_9BURK|nr:hypothetical protein [Piscinibacter lacus]MBL0719730.1 hypothetical protein [Piscinibacter lacus]